MVWHRNHAALAGRLRHDELSSSRLTLGGRGLDVKSASTQRRRGLVRTRTETLELIALPQLAGRDLIAARNVAQEIFQAVRWSCDAVGQENPERQDEGGGNHGRKKERLPRDYCSRSCEFASAWQVARGGLQERGSKDELQKLPQEGQA